MKEIQRILLALIIIFSSMPLTGEEAVKAAEPVKAATPPKEVLDKTFLYEIVRHLYRWYLDEIDIENIAEKEGFVFNLRKMDIKLDEGDKSQYVELYIPGLRICVTLKKSDYRIDELDVDVKSSGFKIVNVNRYEKNFEIPDGCTEVNIDMKEMKEYLFKTRMNAVFPSPELYERIRIAFRKEFGDELRRKLPKEAFKKDWVTFVAPLSPVANEFWAFFENGKILVRCSSDIELTNTSVWEHDTLNFKIYDLLNQVVLSLEEAAGDNSFMTRDQIGRILFNCVVIGDRLIVKQPAENDKQEEKK